MNRDAVAEKIGLRLKQYRLNQDLTQEALAELAGVSLKAVKNAESGVSTLTTYIAIMDALGRLDQLLAAFPDEGISPVQLLKSSTQQKQRASGKNVVKRNDDKELDW